MRLSFPEKIKAVIFDVDGLMIDSDPVWDNAYEELLKKYHIPYDYELIQNSHGQGLKDFITVFKEKYSLETSVDTLLDEYREMFYQRFFNPQILQTLEGVEEIVKLFYEKGFQLAIATGGHTKESMERMLTSFNLLKYFSLIISSDETHKGKPDPEVFIITAARLERKPEECLVLEDSVRGVLAGKRAGMVVYGVNKDEKIYSELKEKGADEVLHSLLEIV